MDNKQINSMLLSPDPEMMVLAITYILGKERRVENIQEWLNKYGNVSTDPVVLRSRWLKYSYKWITLEHRNDHEVFIIIGHILIVKMLNCISIWYENIEHPQYNTDYDFEFEGRTVVNLTI